MAPYVKKVYLQPQLEFLVQYVPAAATSLA